MSEKSSSRSKGRSSGTSRASSRHESSHVRYEMQGYDNKEHETEVVLNGGDCNPYESYTRYLQRNVDRNHRHSTTAEVGYGKPYEEYVRYLQDEASCNNTKDDGDHSASYESYAWYLQHKYDMFIGGSNPPPSEQQEPVPTSIAVPVEERDDDNDDDGEVKLKFATRMELLQGCIGARPPRQPSIKRSKDSPSSISKSNSMRSSRSKGARSKLSTAAVRLNCIASDSGLEEISSRSPPPLPRLHRMASNDTKREQRHKHVTIRMASGHSNSHRRHGSINRRVSLNSSRTSPASASHSDVQEQERSTESFLSYVDEYLDRNGSDSRRGSPGRESSVSF